MERLKRQLFGKKAETVDPAQVQLAFGPVLDALERARTGGEAERTEVEAQLESLRERARAEVARRKAEKKGPKPHGRRDLSLREDLPVETIVLEPPERLVPGGEALVKIGEEVSEHVDHRPASLVRVRVVRNKYRLPEEAPAREDGSRIVIAELPARPIPKGIAGPGLLAHVLVSKFADHLPLHRQESIYRRAGLRLARSTLCGFVQGTVTLLGRVVDAMWEDARERRLAGSAPMPPARSCSPRSSAGATTSGWSSPSAITCSSASPRGTTARSRAKLFEGFRGYLLADASAVYHELYRQEPGVTEVGCWAHARRKLFDALSSDEGRALVGIGFIGLLYDAHRLATDPKTGITDGARRRADAAPVIEKLYAWMAAERPRVDDDAPIAKAMNYIVNHRVPLTRFLDDGIPAARQQPQRARAPPRGGGAQELALLRQRRRRALERRRRLAHRELPAPRSRAVGLPARRPHLAPRLAGDPRPRALPQALEGDFREAAHSAAPRIPALARSRHVPRPGDYRGGVGLCSTRFTGRVPGSRA
ncbi:MAG: IS66 family transposase [Anaeromyxobacter sp.]